MQPRYFIGITLPDTLTEKIEKLQKDLLAGQKVMEPLVPHITLLHPNILMTLAPIYFVPKIQETAAEFLPFEIELTKTDLFDKRVLHIAVKSPGLLKLQAKLVELLPDDIRARYEVGREYIPHVTVIQAKPLQELPDELVTDFKTKLDPLLPKTFEAKNLTQFTRLRPRVYKTTSI